MFCPAALCEEAQNNRLKAFEVLPEEKVDNGGQELLRGVGALFVVSSTPTWLDVTY
jgi:hypothetical protein